MAYPKNHDGESDVGRDYGVAAEELRQFVERIEQLEAEEKEIRDQKKEVYSEAKGRGYNTPILRQVVARRKKDRDDLAEQEATLEMYEEALLV